MSSGLGERRVDDPAPGAQARLGVGGTSNSSASQYALRIDVQDELLAPERDGDRVRRVARVGLATGGRRASRRASGRAARPASARPGCRTAPAPAGAPAISPRQNAANLGVPLDEVPVEPAELAVLAIGVVVAALRPADLVAHREHRHADREHRDREQVLAPGASRSASIAGSSVGPSTPQSQHRFWSLPSRLSSPFASLCFASYETTSLSVKPSWQVTKLMVFCGSRSRRGVDVGASRAAAGRPAHARARVALDERADVVPEAAVPLAPSGRPRTNRPGTGRPRPTPRR